MKIDLEVQNLRFVWDTQQKEVSVFRPARKIDSFKLSATPELGYDVLRNSIKQYLLDLNTRTCNHDKHRAF